MPDSQSSEPGFESPLLPFQSCAFSFSPRSPSSHSRINEYLAIDGNIDPHMEVEIDVEEEELRL